MEITSFSGLNNVSDPMRLGLGTLVQADNINITDTGAIAKREGYALARSGAFSSAYSTLDFSRSYLATATAIQTFAGVTLIALTSSAPVCWAEVNKQVFFNNGTDSGVIMPDDTVLPWSWAIPTTPAVSAVTGTLPAGTYQVRCTYVLDDGRETGASDSAAITLIDSQALRISSIPSRLGVRANVYIAPADSEVFQLFANTTATALTFNASPDALGRDLLNAFLDPLPTSTDVIQVWQGRVYAAQYMAAQDQTAVWFSEALGFHLFNLNSNFIVVPGRVHMLAPHDAALLIGTESRVYAYDGAKLDQVADYGVVPGQHWSRDDERILFWTTHGLCAALPFSNLTETQISVAPGVRAGGCLVRSGGQKRYLVSCETGGSAFNAREVMVAPGVATGYTKDPDATVTYLFDWSRYLTPTGDTIASVAWLAESPLVVGASSRTASTASVAISGGVAGTTKTLRCRVTTALGSADDQTITLEIINQ